MRTSTPWGVWEPASPEEVAAELRGIGASWWIAGRWAIVLAVGRPVREHFDTDVLILRRDQLTVQEHLAGRWELWPPSLRERCGLGAAASGCRRTSTTCGAGRARRPPGASSS